eukprot:1956415-Prymnesium_polylepis.1
MRRMAPFSAPRSPGIEPSAGAGIISSDHLFAHGAYMAAVVWATDASHRGAYKAWYLRRPCSPIKRHTRLTGQGASRPGAHVPKTQSDGGRR